MPIYENHFILDLEKLVPRPTACRPECEWLFSKSVEELSRLPWRRFFLLSLDETSANRSVRERGRVAELIRGGLATGFGPALAYIEDLIEGRAAAPVAKTLCGHLRHMASSAGDPYLLERATFARQFATPIPSQGLNGFLQKRERRFELEPKTREGLEALAAWMRRPG